jgi:hypothetical protein
MDGFGGLILLYITVAIISAIAYLLVNIKSGTYFSQSDLNSGYGSAVFFGSIWFITVPGYFFLLITSYLIDLFKWCNGKFLEESRRVRRNT